MKPQVCSLWIPYTIGAWEESLFMVDAERGKRRLRFLVKWTLRRHKDIQSSPYRVVPLSLGIQALRNLPRNVYTEKLLHEAAIYLAVLQTTEWKLFLDVMR